MSTSNTSKHPSQQRYPAELRERAVRMVREATAEGGESFGIVTRVARQLGIGARVLPQLRLAAGCSISQISRELDLERGTVYRFARAGSLDELLVKTTTRQTLVDGFEPYLQRRWNEGCMNAARLHNEIRAQGFSGGVQIVRRYVRRFRTTAAASATQPTQLKTRQVTSWIMQEPTSMNTDEQESPPASS